MLAIDLNQVGIVIRSRQNTVWKVLILEVDAKAGERFADQLIRATGFAVGDERADAQRFTKVDKRLVGDSRSPLHVMKSSYTAAYK